jgi:SAM-dependent methyltransferase
MHGQQATDPARRGEPLAYFTREGPAGDVFAFDGAAAPRRVAVVGLGIGALAAYAGTGDDWTFLELDPDVVRVARDSGFFSHLADCRAERLRIVVGDGRIGLRAAPAGAFDRIILDAFGSDAVPIHLMTREAVAEYVARLAPGGVIAMNLSNRYLDLAPVVGALAREAGLSCRVRYDVNVTPAEKKAGREPSIWAVLARSESDLGGRLTGERWTRPVAAGRAWTDDRADVLSALRLGGGRTGAGPAGAGTIQPDESRSRPRASSSPVGGPS